MSDRIAVMNEGRVEQIGTPTEIYDNPASVFVAGFIGQANLCVAEVDSLSGGVSTATVMGSKVTAACRSDDVCVGPAVIMVRPERITLSVQRPEGVSAVEVTVTDLTFQGPVVRVSMAGAGEVPVIAHVGPDAELPALRPGDRIWAAWATDAACVLPPAEIPVAEDALAQEN